MLKYNTVEARWFVFLRRTYLFRIKPLWTQSKFRVLIWFLKRILISTSIALCRRSFKVKIIFFLISYTITIITAMTTTATATTALFNYVSTVYQFFFFLFLFFIIFFNFSYWIKLVSINFECFQLVNAPKISYTSSIYFFNTKLFRNIFG